MSGKGKEGRQLSTDDLLSEIRNHKNFDRTQPTTALISVTVSFIDVLNRAFARLHKGDKPDQIWIVFISVPYKDKGVYHHAEDLAREIEHNKPSLFKDEYIFVWEIPEKYMVHKISVQTLLERGLTMECYYEDSYNGRRLPSTSI